MRRKVLGGFVVLALVISTALPLSASAETAPLIRSAGTGETRRVISAEDPLIRLDPATATKPQRVAPAGYEWKLLYYDSFDNWVGWESLGNPNHRFELSNSTYYSPPTSAHSWYVPNGMLNVGCGDSLMCQYMFDFRGAIDYGVEFQHVGNMSNGDIMWVTSNYINPNTGFMDIAYLGTVSSSSSWQEHWYSMVGTVEGAAGLALDMDVSMFGTGSSMYFDDVEVWAMMPAAPCAQSRISGPTRYSTATAISKATFPNGAETAVIATGLNFPDALAGACLANANEGPILLVSKVLPPEVKAELKRLKAKNVYVLGGTAAVPAGVVNSLKAMGIGVKRIAGANRFETAAAIARTVNADLMGGVGDTAIIATGANFPDALAGSPLSGAKGWPVLLVNKGSVPASTKKALRDLGITKTIVLGASGVISNSVANSLPGHKRLGGSDRYETMRLVGSYAFTQGMGERYMSLATGLNYPDALAGSVRTARQGGVLLLTPPKSLCTPARSLIVDRGSSLDLIEAYGETDVVSAAALNTAVSLAK